MGDDTKNTGAGDTGAAGDTGKTGDTGKAGESGTGDTGKAGDTKAGDTGKTGDSGTGGTGADGKAGKDDTAKPEPKAPETYTLKIPAGAETYLDAASLKAFEGTARKHGLTNDQAQAALDEHADALAEQSTAFLEATKADPTYGGDNLAETQRFAMAALDRVRPKGTPRGDAIRSMLARTGYGNNLEVVALLADLGKMMAEDATAGGGSGRGAPPKDAATVLYGGNS